MLTNDALVALAGFALVSSATPGPNNLMLMSSGTHFGFLRTLPHLTGVTLGFVFLILCVGAGLIKLFEIVPGAHLALKIGSVSYLLWLAWKIATAPTQPPADAAEPHARRPMTFVQAALFQWVNPKAWTMALGAVAAYVPLTHPVVGLGLVAMVFGLINLPSCGCWVAMGMQLRRILDDPGKLRVFNVGAAALLVASLYPVVAGQH